MTVKQAIATLKNEGTVVARQGMGVYVRSTTTGESRAPDLAGINSRLDQLEARIHAIENRVGLSGDR
jgi:DNA-binding GntR family transcriptional regulator